MSAPTRPRPTPRIDGAAPSSSEPRPARARRRRLRALLVVAALAATVVAGPRVLTWSIVRTSIAHDAADIQRLRAGEHRAALVLGAGLDGSRRPSPLLDDRVRAAVSLLAEHRVDVIIMSGDNSAEDYDEPSAMRRRAIELGATPTAVAADYAGRRTWDSCVRANEVFGLRRAVVVTSAFHVDRAVVSCRAAGVDATGMSVDDSRFDSANRAKWRLRELAASTRALIDAWVLRPEPAVGGAPIDPWDACAVQRSLSRTDADPARAACPAD